MNIKRITDLLSDQQLYRHKQVKQLVFRDLIDDWSQATTLSIDLRNKLGKEIPLSIDAKIIQSKDEKTAKALITFSDNLQIETVLMMHEGGRNTVCVSSQIGCPLECAFCATGKMGFQRNLTVGEIIDQVLLFARYLKKSDEKVTNIVFMGMGEPMLNYENVLEAIKILNDKDGFNLGIRHFSISTVGIVEGIRKLADEPLQINLAISLHAPNDKLRTQLIKINEKYSIEEILRAVDYYISKTNRKVMFEYVMIKDVNDSNECARELVKLMGKSFYFASEKSHISDSKASKRQDRGCKSAGCHFVNLIPYNPTGNFLPSTQERIKAFKDILMQHGIMATQRYRFGDDIQGACGQLAGGSV